MAEVSVFAFTDVRAFLRSTFAARRATRPGYSLAEFSRQLSLGSDNYARLVLDGKRKLTSDKLHGAAAALGLSFEETEYLEVLVLQESGRSPAAKRYYRRRLRALRGLSPTSTARFGPEAFFAEWFHPVLLLAVDQTPPAEAVARVQRVLPLEETHIFRILAKLRDQGLLEEIDGRYRPKYSHQIFHDKKSRSVWHKRFLANQLKLSTRMLAKNYERGAKFYAHTFSLSHDDFAHYADRVRALLAEFAARSDRSPPDRVAQLNVQLFEISPENT